MHLEWPGLLSRSLADASVTELLAELDEQLSDESSPLRTGNVTSAAKGLEYTTSVADQSTSADTASAVDFSVVHYQEKGLFGFTSVAWYTTEASEVVALQIQRSHGNKGVMTIGYNTSDATATGGDDYETSAGIIRFYDGDTSKEVHIPLIDDAEKEAHFESFIVSLSLQGPINDGAALMKVASKATVFLYDYGDGIVLANTTFIAPSEISSAAPTLENETSTSSTGFGFGWAVIDNGGQGGWMDSNGFAAKDAVFGVEEYGKWCCV